MLTVSTMEAREKLSELINLVAYGGERVTLTRRGKPLVVMVPVEDERLIRALEDQIDLEEARKALQEPGRIPLEQVKRELGL